ncbi:MAG: glycerophosphodiester phosphodiesterase, partial [Candidatus Hydrogenedentes bacterium]|nr:glycerophosphodiester phosphodiesterase [Candidatus Hydrogenedentota bacterium]
MAVIAHRGASAYAPENTLAAFELAAQMDADWYELDCLLAKDGSVVVSHDNDVDRCTDGTGLITEMTLAELKTLDAGSWKD